VLLKVLVLAVSLSAPAGDGAEAQPSTSGGAASASIDDLAWMAGLWTAESDGVRMEEYWMPPRGGLMLGLHRDVPASGQPFFEYLRIETQAEGIVYQASPGGQPPTPFRLTELGDRRAVFSNPDHDFPQRILYWIEGDVLHARIEGEMPGGVRGSEWVYRRSGTAGPEAP
jgi:hypothetical protein